MKEEHFSIRDARGSGRYFIDNEFIDVYAKLCGINAVGVYSALCRHANKEQECFPSIQLIAEELKIGTATVKRAITILKKFNIIGVLKRERKKDGVWKNNTYILLDKNEWNATQGSQGSMVSRDHTELSPGITGIPIQGSHRSTKDTNREGYTYGKDTNIANSSNSRIIQEVMSVFYEINPTLNFANKTQRNAVTTLVRKLKDEEKVIGAARAAVECSGQKYAPRITTPIQLVNKLGDLIAYVRQQNESQEETRTAVI